MRRDIQEAIRLSDDLASSFGLRNEMFVAIEDIYLMNEKSNVPVASHIMETLDPDDHNAVEGAARLLGSTDPHWSVPKEINAKSVGSASDGLEKQAEIIWQAAGRVKGKPRHYELAKSALLFDEVCIVIKSTDDIVAANPNDPRAAEIAHSAPLLFDVINPLGVFPEVDDLGLASIHFRQYKKVGYILDVYGDKAKAVLGEAKRTDRVTLKEYWDYENHYVWVDDKAINLLPTDKNEWGFIPVVSAVMEGSDLFQREGQQTRHPFLYAEWKSQMHKRRNMALTVMYSLIFSTGANAQYIYQRNQEGKDIPVVDYSTPGGVIALDPGEQFGQLAKQVIDPSMREGLNIAERKGTESTMYRQALGESLGSGSTFSEVSLLSQAGRLPLVMYQRMLSEAIGNAMKIGFRILNKKGGEYRARGSKNIGIINAADIPEDFEIDAELKIGMPQDERQNVMIAMQATSGDNPLLSVETAQEKWIGIEQPGEEKHKIWTEKAETAMFMQAIQTILRQMEAAQQQPVQPQPGGQLPQQGMPMPQPGSELPPEAMPPDVQQTGASQGMPGIGMAAPADPRIQQGMEGING